MQSEYNLALNSLDKLTRSLATKIVRRKFLGSVLAGVASILGSQFFDERLASAQPGCNSCNGSCGNCSSFIQSCCAGGYCRSLNCVCASGCGPCGNFMAYLTVCANGTSGSSCGGCS
jgi:hypothetical protein